MSTPRFEVRLLGRFAVVRDGDEIPAAAFGGRLTRRLVRMLASRPGAFWPKDALADALWPERAPADPAANLEVLVSRARRAFGEPDLILTGPGGYAFAGDVRCRVDAADLLAATSEGRAALSSGRSSSAGTAFLRGVETWAGEPFAEDTYEEWAAEPRAVLAAAYVESLEGGAVASLQTGDLATAVSLAGRASIREPLREASAMLHVRALAASGDAAGGLAVFDAFRGRLADELGLDPSPEAFDLQGRVLRGEPLPGVGTLPAPERPRSAASNAAFVGREDEVAAVVGAPRVAIVTGVSGSGKTRLLDEVVARHVLPVVRATAFFADRAEPWGLGRSVLREILALDATAANAIPSMTASALVDLVPELADVRDVEASRIDPESKRALAFEGARRLLEHAAGGPVAVVVDDLQWADATSLDLLATLVDRVPVVRLVVSVRPDEITRWSPPASFLDDLARAHDVVDVALAPLTMRDVATLVGDGSIADVIVTETDGTPLVVTEVIRTLTERGVVHEGADGSWRPTGRPDEAAVRDAARQGARVAIETRVRRLRPDPRRLLELLAMFRREAPARSVALADGRPERLVTADLDLLARAGLARSGDSGWRLAHDAVTHVLLGALPTSEAALRHRAVAAVLQKEGSDPADVAWHLRSAGSLAEAISTYADAADLALRRFAAREAIALVGSALGLEPQGSVRVRLLATRAEAGRRTGDLAGARDDLRAALTSAASAPERALLLTRTAELESGSEDYERAGQLVELAIAEASETPARRAEALAVGSIVDLNLGLLERSRERADAALALFGSLGDPRGAAGILDGRAMASFIEGRIREAVDAFDRVARLFHDAGELLRVGTPRSTRGHALVFMDRAEDGLHDVDEALDLELSLDHAEGEAYARWHRSEALAALGRSDEAVSEATEALAIAERIGHREWTAASLRGLGIALAAGGDLDAAIAAHRRGLVVAEGMPLFRSWAASRLAICLVAAGRVGEAGPTVDLAVSTQTPLTAYEARWAEAEYAAAIGSPDAATRAADAARVAEQGGYLASVERLKALAGSLSSA